MNIKINEEFLDINPKSGKYLKILLKENNDLHAILVSSKNETEFKDKLKQLAFSFIENDELAMDFYKNRTLGNSLYQKLSWHNIAAIRILDYLKNSGREFFDLNIGETIINDPFKLLWLAYKYGQGGAQSYFFIDMLQLFRQLNGKLSQNKPEKLILNTWMERYPAGTSEEIVNLRNKNKERIINVIIKKIDEGEIKSSRYTFNAGLPHHKKFQKVLSWWNEHRFHLKFAIRSPELLNEMLGYSLEPSTLKLLYQAKSAGIPFFVNPYYLSLLNVHPSSYTIGTDLAIRDYILYSRQLIEEYGNIVAWEREDIVKPGKPNAAGWILPTEHNLHRRYPEVAILIPDTAGRACGGLCVSCQRMYDFQNGHLNFNLGKLKPTQKWSKKLQDLMKYFENDAQIRDILITGGDALMSSDKSLENILEAIYTMAVNKKEQNSERAEGEKYAEMKRVRLGTRLPVYLPQRITPSLIKVLTDFKNKASKIGIQQFVIQTHFVSPLEVTPEAVEAIKMLHSAGWMVANQLVFTAAASRRGHTAKLRKVLNDIGVLTYYTFGVKGYKENSHNFATNARAVQEQIEEKSIGQVPQTFHNQVAEFSVNTEDIVNKVNDIREKANIPFLATDRNVLNLPGVGKSLTFRVIGITRGGRRILEFDHDANRNHSPIIHELGRIAIIESKPLGKYLEQLEEMGEDASEYDSIFGYSIGFSEPRMSVFEYPEFEFTVTDRLTNFSLSDDDLQEDNLVA